MKKALYVIFALVFISSFVLWFSNTMSTPKPVAVSKSQESSPVIVMNDSQLNEEDARKKLELHQKRKRYLDQLQSEYRNRHERKAEMKLQDIFSGSGTRPSSSNRTGVEFDDYLAQNDQKLKREFQIDQNDIYENIDKANIAFNVPTSHMNLNDKMVISLLVDMDKSEKELTEILQKKRESQRILTDSGIDVSDVMEAKLIGSAFKITPVTPERQGFGLNGSNNIEWKWEIQAIEEGSHILFLQLNAIITLDDEKETRSIKTYEKEIAVYVSTFSKVAGFVGTYWQWLWTAILIPIVSWIIKRKKKSAQ